MRTLFAAVLAAGLLAAAAGPQSFTGVITDTMCGANHKAMKIAPDSKCVRECVKHGSQYALLSGNTVYVLSDQQTPEKFAAQKVKVTGALNEKTKILKVDKIEPFSGNPPAAPGEIRPLHAHALARMSTRGPLTVSRTPQVLRSLRHHPHAHWRSAPPHPGRRRPAGSANNGQNAP